MPLPAGSVIVREVDSHKRAVYKFFSRHLAVQDTGLSRRAHEFKSRRENHFRAVVQLVRILACHASGRGFDSRQSCQTMGILPPSVMAWVKDTFLTRWAEAWVFPQTMNVAFRKAIIRLGLAAPQWVTSYSPSVHRSD